MKPEEVIRQKIDKILSGILSEKIKYSVESSDNVNFGDLTSNVALIYFSRLKDKFSSAYQLAQMIIEELKKDDELNKIISEIKVEGPGFINFRLTSAIFTDFINRINSDNADILRFDESKDKPPLLAQRRVKVMVEFAHPNTHKQFHLGHLRTLLIGGSLSKIFEAAGYEVYRANYQGDIGPHVAKAIYGVLKLLKERNISLESIEKTTVWEKAKFLQEAYTTGNQEYEQNKDNIDELNNKIYQKDQSVLDVYNRTRTWSLEYFEEIYKTFGIVFDKLFFESETADCGKKIVLENVGKVFENDNGTVIFPGEKYGLHTRVFVTKSGNPTYEGKDMCLAQKQYQLFPFDLNIHVVASEQKEYFKVIFKALELIDPKFKGKQFHLSMGMVNLTSGKMSSRTGEIVSIEELLSLVKREVEKLVGDGRIQKDEKENSISKIAMAAIIYSYLKVNPTLNLVFDIEKSISLDGDSGPYLLYSYARIQSVIARSNIKDQISKISVNILKEEDLLLARKLYAFVPIVEKAIEQYSPNLICNYLYDLAREFNSYYQEVSILKAENQQLINIRLVLISSVAKVLKTGLALLNIETVEKM